MIIAAVVKAKVIFTPGIGGRVVVRALDPSDPRQTILMASRIAASQFPMRIGETRLLVPYEGERFPGAARLVFGQDVLDVPEEEILLYVMPSLHLMPRLDFQERD